MRSSQDKRALLAQLLEKKAKESRFPLSFAQQRLWFLDQLVPDSPFCNMPGALRLRGSLNQAALGESLNTVVARHETLRTTFAAVNGQPAQVIAPSLKLEVPVVDLSDLIPEEREAKARDLAERESQRPFDLSRGPLLRAQLLRLSEDDHILVYNMHHIVSDGWSIGVLVEEIAALYPAFVAGERSPLTPLPIQYADFAQWQREWLQGEVLEEQLGYWKRQLAGLPEVLALPTDRPRPVVQSFRGARHPVRVSPRVTEGLRAISNRTGTTSFMTVLAAFQVLLYRYSGQTDFAVGCPIANRNRAEIERLIGFFVNTLVLRADVSGDPTFLEFLAHVKEDALGAYDHQDLPFERLVDELQPERSLSHMPLVQVTFDLQRTPVRLRPLRLPGLELSPWGFEPGTAKFDLFLDLEQEQGGLYGALEYNTDLFDSTTAARMMAHFAALLESIVSDPEQRIADLPLLTGAERHQLIVGWNGTETAYPRARCIHELFEARVEKSPEATAVSFGAESLSYAELNRRANQLAHYLCGLGVGPDVLVAICLERSLEMVVGLLGILKAGGAYVPLDAGYPKERLTFMLEDTRAPVVLTQEALLEALPAAQVRLVCLDRDWDQIGNREGDNPVNRSRPEHLAYVTYTSGSTGRPKGVGVPHRGVVRLVQETNYLAVTAQDVFLQFAPVSFDASTLEIWGSLLNGARLVVMPPERPSLEELAAVVRGQGITTLWLTAPLFHLMVDKQGEALRGVRQLLAGGDVLSVSHVQKALEVLRGGVVINGYGPTENTTFTCCHPMKQGEKLQGTVPIGRPIANTQVYILDRELNPVPIGVAGELHIGGVGLARGYLNRAGLTAEKFIPHPLSEEPGARLYQTGDLARYLPDGNIEFLGRNDFQVKIRGFRIELDEIESTLAQHPAVGQAVVLAREDSPEDKRLVAYVSGEQGAELDVGTLRAFLRERLPEHMVPVAYVLLEALPLTSNGKVDRKALPAPEGRPELAQAYEAPHTPTEQALANIWSEVLRIERLGIHDNFFELGGHSLLATRAVSRIRHTFEVDLPLRTLFEMPSVAGLAEAIEKARRSGLGLEVPPIQAVARDRELPLSFAQQRLWFLTQLVPDNPFYNMPGALRVQGRLDVGALAESLNAIVARHEALHTTFTTVNGQAVQTIAPGLTLEVPVVDLRDRAPAEQEARARAMAMKEAQQPFDLSRGPLLRVQLLRFADDDHVLVYSMHHIVSDGWSMGIFVEELAALYSAFVAGEASPLQPLPVQYADFAHWQRAWLQGEALEKQLAYWKGQLEGLPEVLALPTDRPRPAVQSFRGAHHPVVVSAEVTEGLRVLSRKSGSTLFMTLLAAFQVLLYRYTGQRDFAVGSPIANRNREEIERLIGFFVNTLVLRADLSGNPTFVELVGRVKEVSLGAYTHQDLPFEQLVEELQPARAMSHEPLVQVVFALQNAPMRPLRLPELDITMWKFDAGTTRFDLEVHLWEQDEGGLGGFLEYNTDLFEVDTTRRMVEHFQVLLESVLHHRSRRISDLPLLTEAEHHQLVVGWNATETAYPRARGIHELFEARVEKSPEATAVSFGAESLSYAELNRRANQLAHYLRDLGVGPDVLVVICMERSLEMVVGLLGILKAGGTYVPLDADYPKERLTFMVYDSGAPVLLTHQRLRDRLQVENPNCQILCLDADWETISRSPTRNPISGVRPENLAYVIYTSGSTGEPKGVELMHGGLLNLIFWHRRTYQVSFADKVTQLAGVGFDASVWELWPYLTAGASIHMPDEDTRLLPEKLRDWLVEHEITLSFVPTPLAEALVTLPWPAKVSLRGMLTGGDRLTCRVPPALPFPLVNHYGPTESTVVTTCAVVDIDSQDGKAPTIGKPIANTQVYILDRELNPVPIGVAGELHIGGAGLARGYLNRAGLTAEKFIPHPLSEEPGARLYQTGDLARYLPDGNIEFLGRNDFQVKIRGFRIELGEIESTLAQHPAVGQAVVLAREDSPEDKRLVAYAVVEPQALDRLEPASGLQGEQVALWEALYEDTYGQGGPLEDPTFDITGWNSSYTDQPIPAGEMREWVEETVGRVRALHPQAVLEIGCGTGLLLLRLAPEAVDYVGVDFSKAVLGQLRARLAQMRDGSRVTLLERRADDLRGLEAGRFDTVILNSVVQYFPHIDYLLGVLEGAIERVKPGGRVFVGDVRSLPLLEAFHASVELARAEPSCTRAELGQRVHSRLSAENELVVAPGFFVALKERFPRIRQVEIRPKRGWADNELSKFRYDVSLELDAEVETVPELKWQDWRKEGLSLEEVGARLRAEQPRCLGLRGVPNARVSREVGILEWLGGEAGPETVGEVREAWEAESPGIDPEAFWALGEELPYAVEVSWAQGHGDGGYEVMFWRRSPEAGEMPRGVFPSGPVMGRSWTGYANNPLAKKLTAQLVPELRAFLQEKLPDYMVPVAYVFLDALPLTPNGKVDRKALPGPEGRPELAQTYEAPHTPVEEALADIWVEVLGIERVGIYDNFFELGGHSLLATQVVSRIREALQVELPLRSLFEMPTVAGLAGAIERAQQSGLGLHSTPIQLVSRDQELPLSFAQQRLWFLAQLVPDNPFYNMPGALRLGGKLDTEALAKSIDTIVARHEALRTTFGSVDGRAMQVIAPASTLELPILALDHLGSAEREARARDLAMDEAQHPFDLSRGPLLRVGLVRLAEDDHVLIYNMHHIVSDGWSMGIFVEELSILYRAFVAGEPSPLAPLPIQYADFAHWQREWLQGEVLEGQLAYWKRQLAGLPEVLALPTDRPRPPVQSYRGAHCPVKVSAEVTEGLRALSRENGATLFMTLLAAFQVMLYRYTGQTDFAVGPPIANRNRAEIERLIGFFVNTLVLRADLTGNPTFAELLARTKEVTLGGYAHQDLPFERLVEELKPERAMSHLPLVQVSLALQSAPMRPLRLPELEVAMWEFDPGTTRFDLVVHLWEQDEGGLWGSLEYNTDLFEAATARRMVEHYQVLLEGVLHHRSRRISDLPLLTASEHHQLVVSWNLTQKAFAQDQCIHQLFEQQVERTPDALAVVLEDDSLTYSELNARANQLAHYLRDLGVGPDVLVAICMERSLEMVVGLLGVLKAGGAYVPLDPAYPRERLVFILEDSRAAMLVTQEALLDRLPGTENEVLCLDLDWGQIAHANDANPAIHVEPENLAYVIYTSGSTGWPKGVMISHRAICNHMLWMQAAFPLSEIDKVLQKTPFGFDASVWEFYAPLLAGAQLVVARPGGHQDPHYLAETMAEQRITTLQVVPSLLELLLNQGVIERFASLRRLFCGGEALARGLQKRFFACHEAELYNLYGPTEASIDVTFWPCERNSERQTAPIGRPIANTQVYILDRELNPVPIGVAGELHIGGAGLARGYLNRAGLTAEKFIPHPLSEEPGARLYKTGDLARYLPDGNIEFLGRNDFQVKIRGFRIELGEIESTLAQHPAVGQAVVLAREDSPEDKRLVAYLVLALGSSVEVQELRKFLQKSLPDYMVPAAYVFLDALPLTSNGKADRKRLPAPEGRPELAQAYEAPHTPTEQALANIWSEVLRIERLGIHDNFFELGGDSILSIQTIARAHEAGLELTPRQLFEHQTIAELAAVAGTAPTIRAEQGVVKGVVPLTPVQLWFFEANLPRPEHFNMSVLVKVREALEPRLLELAVQCLVEHHDALRLRFERTAAGWQQVNAEAEEAHQVFREVDLPSYPASEQGAALEAVATGFQGSLDLVVGPLLRVVLFHLGANQPDRVLLIIHHLAVDGVSWRILLEDLQTAYRQLRAREAVTLPAKTTSFQQWAQRLQKYAQSEAMLEQSQYWLRQAAQPFTSLPVDHERGPNTAATARTTMSSLSADETRALLQEASSAYHTQINDLLLTALAKAVSRWTGAETVWVDLEGHGREPLFEEVDLSRTVGWFTSIFPVCLDLAGVGGPGAAIKAVKEQLRRIPQKGLDYGVLRYLARDADVVDSLASLPQAEITFNYLGQFDQVFSNDALFAWLWEGRGLERDTEGKLRHLISISGAVLHGQLTLNWTYNTELHRPETIEFLAKGFTEALQELIRHCLSPEAGGFTPSDFPNTDLDQSQLDTLLTEYEQACTD